MVAYGGQLKTLPKCDFPVVVNVVRHATICGTKLPAKRQWGRWAGAACTGGDSLRALLTTLVLERPLKVREKGCGLQIGQSR